MYFVVLTGDLVDSTSLPSRQLDAAMADVAKCHSEIAQWLPSDAVTGFGRRGGDGWQLALQDARFSLRAALYIRARLRRLSKSLETRIALAQGAGSMPDRDPNAASGPAFVASGRLIDMLSAPMLMSHADGGAIDAATVLADHVSQRWTQAQARALCELLPPNAGPRRDAARRLGISRQAVDQALWSSGFPAIEAALHALEPK